MVKGDMAYILGYVEGLIETIREQAPQEEFTIAMLLKVKDAIEEP